LNIDLKRLLTGLMKKAIPSKAIETTYPNAENATLVVPGSIYAWALLPPQKTETSKHKPQIFRHEQRIFFAICPSLVS
jgi:hypothetical protein